MNIKRLLLTIGVVSLLSACTTLNFFNPPKFDNVEYANVVGVDLNVQKAQALCSSNTSALKTLLPQISDKLNFLVVYTQHISNDQNSYKIFKIMKSQYDTFLTEYKKNNSALYCEGKMMVLHIEAQRVIKVMAKESR